MRQYGLTVFVLGFLAVALECRSFYRGNNACYSPSSNSWRKSTGAAENSVYRLWKTWEGIHLGDNNNKQKMISIPGASGSTDPCGDGSSQYALSQTKWNSFPVPYHVNADAVTSGVDKSNARVGSSKCL